MCLLVAGLWSGSLVTCSRGARVAGEYPPKRIVPYRRLLARLLMFGTGQGNSSFHFTSL